MRFSGKGPTCTGNAVSEGYHLNCSDGRSRFQRVLKQNFLHSTGPHFLVVPWPGNSFECEAPWVFLHGAMREKSKSAALHIPLRFGLKAVVGMRSASPTGML